MMPIYKAAIREIENDEELRARQRSTSQNSTTNGLIERIVENWLTSATERSFQIPFCQLLSAQGEKLVYIATHGQFEKGKMSSLNCPMDGFAPIK